MVVEANHVDAQDPRAFRESGLESRSPRKPLLLKGQKQGDILEQQLHQHLQSWRGRSLQAPGSTRVRGPIPADRKKSHNGSVQQLSLHARQRCEQIHLDPCRCLNSLRHRTGSQLGVLVRENRKIAASSPGVVTDEQQLPDVTHWRSFCCCITSTSDAM